MNGERRIQRVRAALRPAGESKPDLVMQLQVLRNRQPVITIPVRQISLANSPIKDQIRTGGEFSLKDLAPGRYVLLIAVIDRIAKTTASQEMKFEIRCVSFTGFQEIRQRHNKHSWPLSAR